MATVSVRDLTGREVMRRQTKIGVRVQISHAQVRVGVMVSVRVTVRMRVSVRARISMRMGVRVRARVGG